MYPLSAGIATTVFSRAPDTYRRLVKTAWADANRGGDPVDCFLEGPSFDRAGNLYVVDNRSAGSFACPPAGSGPRTTSSRRASAS
jgi:gluconolactonase